MKLEEAKKLQNVFKSNLNQISKGKFKSEEQKSTLENIIYESREAVSSIISKAKYKSKYGEDLRIITTKQMLQRLTITLAQVITSNTFENLLNEIRQIIYSLYQAKEVNKKVCNNIMNSIKT